MKVPGLQFIELHVDQLVNIVFPDTLKDKIKKNFEVSDEALVSVIKFRIISYKIHTRVSIGKIKKRIRKQARQIFTEQHCAYCRGKRPTLSRLMPRKNRARSISVNRFLHLIVHLALNKLMRSRWTDVRDFEEEIFFLEPDQLWIVLNVPVLPNLASRAINEAISIISPYLITHPIPSGPLK